MMGIYTHILDQVKEVELPADGILSWTICQDNKIGGVVFDSGQGQELSEQTSKIGIPMRLNFDLRHCLGFHPMDRCSYSISTARICVRSPVPLQGAEQGTVTGVCR